MPTKPQQAMASLWAVPLSWEVTTGLTGCHRIVVRSLCKDGTNVVLVFNLTMFYLLRLCFLQSSTLHLYRCTKDSLW